MRDRGSSAVSCKSIAWLSLLQKGQERKGEGRGSGSHPGARPSFLPDTDALAFSRDLSNNKISSLGNSSFTNMSQLTTL